MATAHITITYTDDDNPAPIIKRYEVIHPGTAEEAAKAFVSRKRRGLAVEWDGETYRSRRSFGGDTGPTIHAVEEITWTDDDEPDACGTPPLPY